MPANINKHTDLFKKGNHLWKFMRSNWVNVKKLHNYLPYYYIPYTILFSIILLQLYLQQKYIYFAKIFTFLTVAYLQHFM